MFRYTLFKLQPANTQLMLPHGGFRRLTSALTPTRQYNSLRTPELSDHAPFVLQFAMHNKNSITPYLVPWRSHYHTKDYKRISVLTWNIMMRGQYNETKRRYNNAYSANETKAEYLLRIERIAQNIAECVKKDPNFAMIFLQEAPVCPTEQKYMTDWLEEYLPSHFKVQLNATDWGILTIVNSHFFPDLRKLDTVYAGELCDMNTRKTTFVLPGLKTPLTNLHLPHDKPQEALKLVMNYLAHALTSNIQRNERYGSFVFTGDWNLSAETIETEAIRTLEMLFHEKLPVRCDVSIQRSPAGHIKTDGKVVEVDCSLVVSYKVSHKDLTLIQKELSSALVVDHAVIDFSPRI
ncbi:hypothetical protein [uncultured Legionella sp.]|uniref:hypothetical protein n=1 Tax=uncultured Legionella sp. TaxID=210934 RepID=UPI00262ED9DB|nr:hypothetical protein [uncultured Legionella sp.]